MHAHTVLKDHDRVLMKVVDSTFKWGPESSEGSGVCAFTNIGKQFYVPFVVASKKH